MKNSLLIFLLFFLATQAAGEGPRGVRPDVISEKFGGVYRRPLENDPSTLDPALMMNIYAYTISQQIFDGLVQFDGDLNVIPAIADFWEGSRDGRTWTFQLKKGVKFHNGREVTAQDFVYSFTRLLDPKVKSPIANLLSDIKGARNFLKGEVEQVDGLKALEKYTLQIELEEPFAPFLSILAMANVKVVPKETVENGIQTRPVGTGPF
ncbi:MAG: hypothetical protein HY731_06635, partial [Candidatus Tectomicrobia bacterium]|nr:hypothetical protein [Candidatus Tectomicrobia bacterium]